MSGKRHLKVPQVGRVIIQDDVEIGAGTCIDRGAIHDTVIGEGTKIDNLVQIGHNVVIGRHCILVAQVGISGSVTSEDFVVLGGRSASRIIDIGESAMVAAEQNRHRVFRPANAGAASGQAAESMVPRVDDHRATGSPGIDEPRDGQSRPRGR